MAERHARLTARKVIAARTAVISAYGRVRAPSSAAGAARDYLLRSFTKQETGEVGGAPPRSEPLDVFLGGLGHFLAAARIVARADRKADDLLNSVQGSFAPGSCEICRLAANRPFVCRGDPDDHATVESGGECVQALKAYFTFGRALHQALIKWVWPDGDAPDWLLQAAIEFETSDDYTPHDYAGIPAVTGSIRFSVADGRHLSHIALVLDPDELCQATYNTAVYIIAHEIVAHTFQGPDEAGRRIAPGSLDEWHEGWMDCIANDVFEDVARGHRRVPIPAIARNASDVRVEGLTLHKARFRSQNGDELEPIRDAKNAYNWMRIRLNTVAAEYAPVIVQKASLKLQALGAPPTVTKSVLTAAMRFHPDRVDGLGPEEQSFIDALMVFLDTEDLDLLEQSLRS